MAVTIRNAMLSPSPAWGTRKDGSHVLNNQFLLIVRADRDETVRNVPGLSIVVDDKEKETKQTKKKSEAKRTKYEKWASGLSIPFPGDKDFEEFQEWKKKQTRKMILGKYLAEED